jgi:hypothetical protein
VELRCDQFNVDVLAQLPSLKRLFVQCELSVKRPVLADAKRRLQALDWLETPVVWQDAQKYRLFSGLIRGFRLLRLICCWASADTINVAPMCPNLFSYSISFCSKLTLDTNLVTLLPRLRALRLVNIGKLNFSEPVAMFERLGDRLEVLQLDYCGQRWPSLVFLSSLRKLKELSLKKYSDFLPQDLAKLSSEAPLEKLDISWTNVTTNAALKLLGQRRYPLVEFTHNQCGRYLGSYSPPIVCSFLAAHPDLRALRLDYQFLLDDSVLNAVLVHLPKLELLAIRKTACTVADIQIFLANRATLVRVNHLTGRGPFPQLTLQLAPPSAPNLESVGIVACNGKVFLDIDLNYPDI